MAEDTKTLAEKPELDTSNWTALLLEEFARPGSTAIMDLARQALTSSLSIDRDLRRRLGAMIQDIDNLPHDKNPKHQKLRSVLAELRDSVTHGSPSNKLNKTPGENSLEIGTLKEAFRGGIDDEPTVRPSDAPTVADSFQALDDFTAANPGAPISGYVRELLPELMRQAEQEFHGPSIPTAAPALWTSDKQKGENPVTFIQRAYAPWLGHGLTRSDIRKLDRPLYQALAAHIGRHGLPEGFELPTAQERTDRWIDDVKAGRAPVGDMKAVGRLNSALQRRRDKGRD